MFLVNNYISSHSFWKQLQLVSGFREGKRLLSGGQHLPFFALSAPVPGTMPASLMAAAPAATAGARPVTVAFLTGFGASSSLSLPGGRARSMSAAISRPRSGNRKKGFTVNEAVSCSTNIPIFSALYTVLGLYRDQFPIITAIMHFSERLARRRKVMRESSKFPSDKSNQI